MRHKANRPHKPARSANASTRSLSLEEAAELVPEIPVPTPIAVRMLKVLATPGAFFAMTIGEQQGLVEGIQGALNKAFSTAPKAAPKAG